MKHFLLILVAACCFLSCKKSTTVVPGLFGKWELRRAYGGLSYRDSTYITGNGNVYKFNSDSTYKHFTKGIEDAHGVFHYKKNSYKETSTTNRDEIFFDNTTYSELILITNTKFTIGTTDADGIATDYEKISN